MQKYENAIVLGATQKAIPLAELATKSTLPKRSGLDNAARALLAGGKSLISGYRPDLQLENNY